ncbi:cupin domain-containing protein [Salinisphaera orenii]|uniref:XRE family transcriptional regulator n=1 Tax=Salinisphaera orenii YIM 95161 TaxID=1051139 RepID=A0A423PDM6_9GAMM|nr:cupin domain-containing protein [Salinisphaera halophila]ROO23101.1 XRE family transcriptional regulator [Salinisphaera halophila YIM 95161]
MATPAASADKADHQGERIKALRLQKGLSIRGLAKQSGLTHPFIAMVERNETSPSVSSLKKILSVLDVTLSDFFSDRDSLDRVAFYRADDLVELADGDQVSYRQVGANLRNAQMMLLHERYAPGASTGDDGYSHQAEEGGVVIQGRLEITVGDVTEILGPGDAYYFDSTLPHRMENVSEDECVVVSAVTPRTF